MLRKLRFITTLFAAMAALGFVLTGCELEEDADADTTTTPDVEEDTDPGDTGTDVTDPGLDYRFVRVDDVSGNSEDIDGGADLDSIILDKADGSTVYADTVESFLHGAGFGDMLDPTEALGAPDSFFNYPASLECDVDVGFVSLGGTGGQLIVQMGGAIEAGDTLTVLEVGNCDNDVGIADDVEVFVSVAADDSRDWVALGGGGGSPDITFVLSAGDLPFEPTE